MTHLWAMKSLKFNTMFYVCNLFIVRYTYLKPYKICPLFMHTQFIESNLSTSILDAKLNKFNLFTNMQFRV